DVISAACAFNSCTQMKSADCLAIHSKKPFFAAERMPFRLAEMIFGMVIRFRNGGFRITDSPNGFQLAAKPVQVGRASLVVGHTKLGTGFACPALTSWTCPNPLQSCYKFRPFRVEM